MRQILDYNSQNLLKFEQNSTKKPWKEIRTALFYLRQYGIFIFLGYISKFWRGFFPILIVELYNDNEIEEAKPLSEEYGKLLEQLGHLFGDVHQIPIKESELKGIF